MFTIYIKNYYQNNAWVTTESVVQIIGPDASDIQDEDAFLEDLSIKAEMGKAETFEFSIEPTNPWYNKIKSLKTLFRVQYDTETIFFGRVLDYQEDLFGKRKYHCEGALSFMLDSFQVPSIEAKRESKSMSWWIGAMIDHHNSQIADCTGGDSWKHIYRGEMPGSYSSSESGQRVTAPPDKKFGVDSWTETISCFEELVSENGGYLRMRYVPSGNNIHLYLDWYKDYFRAWNNNMQPIEVSKNLIDQNTKVDVSKLFTVLIPYGNKKGSTFHINGACWPARLQANHANTIAIKVSELDDIYTALYGSASALDNPYYSHEVFNDSVDFGTIYKVQKFENATTREQLFSFAIDWMKNNYRGTVTSMSVKAFDLHLIGESAYQYQVGDQVRISYYNHDSNQYEFKTLCIMSINYDLYNPENNSYNLGIPDNPLNKKYGTKQTGGGGGARPKVDDPPNNEEEEKIKEQLQNLYERWCGWMFDHNADPSDPETELDPNDPNNVFPLIPNQDIQFVGTPDLIDKAEWGKDLYRVLRADKEKVGHLMATKALMAGATIGNWIINQDTFKNDGMVLNGTSFSLGNLVTMAIDGGVQIEEGKLKLGNLTVATTEIETPGGTVTVFAPMRNDQSSGGT